MTVWTNAQLSDEAFAALKSGLTGHDLTVDAPTNNLSVGGPSTTLASADIAFGQPDADQCTASANLYWVHITSAGYTRYDTDAFRRAIRGRNAAFTNSSSVYDEPCAQHLAAFMLALARTLPGCLMAQASGQGWTFAAHRPQTRLLQGDTVLMLGYGAIARRLSELLAPYRLNLVGYRRTLRGDETIPTVGPDGLAAWLPQADHVVNILPANPDSDGLVNADFLAQLKPGARFYNIGRGTTVDQTALMAALASGHLDAVYLDVTDPEPLPADHPLWQTPRCYITPHIGGGFHREDVALVRHFLANLHRFEKNAPLVDRIY